MSYQAQHFTAPDGTEMVVLRADDYARLRAIAEEDEGLAAASALERIAEEGGRCRPQYST